MSSSYQNHELSPPPSPPQPGQQIHPNELQTVLATSLPDRKEDSPSGSLPLEDGDESDSNQEEQLLSSKLEKEPSALKSTLLFIVELLLIPLLMMIPASVLYIFVDFPTYNITKIKSESLYTNLYMEFIRWSIFLASSYSAYIMIEWAIGILPNLIFSLSSMTSNLPGSKFVKTQILYLKLIKFNLTMALFFLFILFFSPVVLYKSALMITPSQESIQKSQAILSNMKLNSIDTNSFTIWIERILIIAVILASTLALQRYFTEMISISFHKSAFTKRIKELNDRYVVITKMFHYAVNRDITALLEMERKRGKSMGSKEFIGIIHDKFLNLNSPERCNQVGDRIFNAFKDRDNVITKSSIQQLFSPETIDDAFGSLDDVEQGRITKDELLKNISSLYFERKDMVLSLVGTSKTMTRLNRALTVIAVIIGLSISVPFFSATIGQAWATLGIFFTMFGFIFQAAGKTIFDSIFFVFVEHTFDIGDRVVIDGENLVVERINLLTTDFVRWDGLLIQIANVILCTKSISNIRRSGYQSEVIELSFDSNITTQKLHEFRNEIVKWIMAEELRDYTGYVDITDIDVTAEKMKITLQVQYRSNFQDFAQKNNRKTKLTAKLKEISNSLGIDYK